MNNQQLRFLQGLLLGIQNGSPQQSHPITVNVTEKHEGLTFQIEVYPNAKSSLPYRLVFSEEEKSLWNSWDDLEEIEMSFRQMSLL